ncbi:aspartate aminotransferase family protein [Bacillus sp. 7504-2]|nr:aspartate aminotransferase family protein [Bacillus sp. 7504-2]
MSYLFPTYARWDVEPVDAAGSYLTDSEGKQYLDFTSGIGVCNLGHRPRVVKEAIEHQLNRFWHVSNLFASGEQEKAAKKLATAAEMDAVFFANSGAEANEAAIKLARKATGKTKIITFNKSFHGRTFATMSATGQDKIKSGFGPMLEKFSYATYNDIDSVKDIFTDDVAAVMLEIIQGEGGVHVGDKSFLQAVEKLCHEKNALLIVDEVQTGIGRTGRPFAFQHFALNPDIVTSAKGLGSGVPIGAILGKENLKPFFGPGSHGSTFGGNPISIAAAHATMNIIFDQVFLKEVEYKGDYLISQLEAFFQGSTFVKEIRGKGLMIGIEFKQSIQVILQALRKEGVLALAAGENVLRLLPPLTASISEIDLFLLHLKKVVETVVEPTLKA